MIRRPPRSTRTYTLFPYTTLFRSIVYAQGTVRGKVTDANGEALPGASVLVKGTTIGTVTDINGNYSLSNVPSNATLVYSFVGMQDQEIPVSGRASINLVLQESTQLEEVVVTGLGISREKRSLGYSVTEIGGEGVTKVKQQNVLNSLSGKIAGVNIRRSNNFGGSTDINIRGKSSLFGGNQPLFIIDGVPVAAATSNSSAQRTGREAYDYGNVISDINPDDIANISVLKGAASTAIYGSRGANGVIMITTKKGKLTFVEGKQRGIGVSISSEVNFGKIDKSTFLEYQDEYGAGYGPYYSSADGYFQFLDVDGDGTKDLAVPMHEDASFGAKFTGQDVFHWDSFVPESDNYLKSYPYRAGKTTPVDFFETETGFTNNVELYGGNELGNFRLSYTNFYTSGILPNSRLNRNTFSFNGDYKINEKLLAGISANASFQNTIGRNSTGYSGNLMTQFRQWWQVNVDIKSQEDIFHNTGKNYSWNHSAAKNGDVLTPLYWDNPYWTRFKNYQSDSRDRLFGNLSLVYNVNDWINATGRVGIDTYSELREERRAVGSVAGEFGISSSGSLTGSRTEETSGYYRVDRNFKEMNFDFLVNFNRTLNEDLTLTGLLGTNYRIYELGQYHASTSGGLVIPNIYALSNSKNSPNPPIERLERKRVFSLFGQVSLGYKNLLYLELTDRQDKTSALPVKNNAYNYYSVSSSLIFSQLLQDNENFSWLNYGKLRASYAEVGNDTDPLNVNDVYVKGANFGSYPVFSYPDTKNNAELKPERTKELEFGLELKALDNRAGLDISYYDKVTEDMLLPVDISNATGFSFRWVNAAKVSNKGLEFIVRGTPIKKDDLRWDIDINWARDKNKVEELFEGVDNLTLRSYSGGITVNATKGQPLGTFKGTGFVFDTNGNRVVNSSGYYRARTDQQIGDQNPDWTAGINNTVTYKDFSLSFLFDIRQGGDIYSLDMHYGQGTGLPATTVGYNDLGNPIRNTLANGGGVIQSGVKLKNDGETLQFNSNGQITNETVPNDIRARADYYAGIFYWGNNSRNPGALTVYDGSFIKLRELSLTYTIPKKYVEKFAQNATISFVGRNLWVDKRVPYADPESGLSAGLAQGYLVGSYPTTKSFGFNLKIDF